MDDFRRHLNESLKDPDFAEEWARLAPERAYLKQLSPDDDVDVYDMLQEIPVEENGFMNGGNGFSFDG